MYTEPVSALWRPTAQSFDLRPPGTAANHHVWSPEPWAREAGAHDDGVGLGKSTEDAPQIREDWDMQWQQWHGTALGEM